LAGEGAGLRREMASYFSGTRWEAAGECEGLVDRPVEGGLKLPSRAEAGAGKCPISGFEVAGGVGCW
jgi:hypothetical protein